MKENTIAHKIYQPDIFQLLCVYNIVSGTNFLNKEKLILFQKHTHTHTHTHTQNYPLKMQLILAPKRKLHSRDQIFNQKGCILHNKLHKKDAPCILQIKRAEEIKNRPYKDIKEEKR